MEFQLQPLHQSEDRQAKPRTATLQEVILHMMRRSAQFMVRAGGGDELNVVQVEEALDEMLFAGGSLNVKLLGGAEV